MYKIQLHLCLIIFQVRFDSIVDGLKVYIPLQDEETSFLVNFLIHSTGKKVIMQNVIEISCQIVSPQKLDFDPPVRLSFNLSLLASKN